MHERSADIYKIVYVYYFGYFPLLTVLCCLSDPKIIIFCIIHVTGGHHSLTTTAGNICQQNKGAWGGLPCTTWSQQSTGYQSKTLLQITGNISVNSISEGSREELLREPGCTSWECVRGGEAGNRTVTWSDAGWRVDEALFQSLWRESWSVFKFSSRRDVFYWLIWLHSCHQ